MGKDDEVIGPNKLVMVIDAAVSAEVIAGSLVCESREESMRMPSVAKEKETIAKVFKGHATRGDAKAYMLAVLEHSVKILKGEVTVVEEEVVARSCHFE